MPHHEESPLTLRMFAMYCITAIYTKAMRGDAPPYCRKTGAACGIAALLHTTTTLQSIALPSFADLRPAFTVTIKRYSEKQQILLAKR
jgi:hypothetical protein